MAPHANGGKKVQELQVEITSIKNLKWRESENKNLEILAGSSETSLTNRK